MRFADDRPMAIILVHGPLDSANKGLAEVAVRADRRTLGKRLWRGAADDGTQFGFELRDPLGDGDAVWASSTARYVVRQAAEPVLEIPLDPSAPAAAMIGWAVGNLHFPVEARDGRLLAPDDPALRQSLDRIGVGYRASVEVFRPHRLAAGHGGHSHSHHHHHGDGHHGHGDDRA
jgi:urease accessory protein